jgi:hypothetical protein
MSAYAIPEVWAAVHQLATPAGTITFNADTGDAYLHDPANSSGLWLAGARSSMEDRPQAHGEIVHPTLLKGRHLTCSGIILPRDGGFTARNTMMATLGEALVSISDTDGTYTVTVDGTTYSFAVRFELAAPFTGLSIKTYLFGLVAGEATATVT